MKNKLLDNFIILLFLMGVGVSIWLLQIHFQLSTGSSGLQNSCSAFGKNAGCEAIALSSFSTIWIFPLAGIALAYYITQIFLRIWALLNYQTRMEPLFFSYNLASIATTLSLGLAIISNNILKSFCSGCAALWLINLLAWILMICHLEIRWWQLFAANLETIRNKIMNLSLPRVKQCIINSGICFAVVLGIITLVYQSEKSKLSAGDLHQASARFQNASQIFIAADALEGERSKGAETQSAILQIVKFSDFQCPACKKAAQYFKPFFLKHQDKIRFSYRNFPLDGSCNPYAPNGGHYMACTLAMAGICAAKQNKFQEFHNLVFDRQEELTPAVLKEVIDVISLDKNSYETCLASQTTKDELLRDITLGETATIQSTPTFIVNGRKIEGGFTPEQWEEVFRIVEKGK